MRVADIQPSSALLFQYFIYHPELFILTYAYFLKHTLIVKTQLFWIHCFYFIAAIYNCFDFAFDYFCVHFTPFAAVILYISPLQDL